jgi:hypothetical protein
MAFNWRIKSPEEIWKKCWELVKRHRRRFIQSNSRPCPWNCAKAEVSSKHEVVGCRGCGSRNPEFCKNHALFHPLFTKKELVTQFKEKLKDPQTLLREYRDLVVFFWCLNMFDMETLDGKKISDLEKVLNGEGK